MALDPKTLDRCCKLLLMLSSQNDAEIAAAATALMRTLRAANADLHDIVEQLKRPADRIARSQVQALQKKLKAAQDTIMERDQLIAELRAAAAHRTDDTRRTMTPRERQLVRDLLTHAVLSRWEIDFLTGLRDTAPDRSLIPRQYRKLFEIRDDQEHRQAEEEVPF